MLHGYSRQRRTIGSFSATAGLLYYRLSRGHLLYVVACDLSVELSELKLHLSPIANFLWRYDWKQQDQLRREKRVTYAFHCNPVKVAIQLCHLFRS